VRQTANRGDKERNTRSTIAEKLQVWLKWPMSVNADKPQLWKADTRASVDQFNQWFMSYAPNAYRDTRSKTVEHVE
jgi:hypothetical protein